MLTLFIFFSTWHLSCSSNLDMSYLCVKILKEFLPFRMIFKYFIVGFIYVPFRVSASVLCRTLEVLGMSVWMKHRYSVFSWNLTATVRAYRIGSQKAFHTGLPASCSSVFLSTPPLPYLFFPCPLDHNWAKQSHFEFAHTSLFSYLHTLVRFSSVHVQFQSQPISDVAPSRKPSLFLLLL